MKRTLRRSKQQPTVPPDMGMKEFLTVNVQCLSLYHYALSLAEIIIYTNTLYMVMTAFKMIITVWTLMSHLLTLLLDFVAYNRCSRAIPWSSKN